MTTYQLILEFSNYFLNVGSYLGTYVVQASNYFINNSLVFKLGGSPQIQSMFIKNLGLYLSFVFVMYSLLKKRRMLKQLASQTLAAQCPPVRLSIRGVANGTRYRCRC